MKGIDSSSNNKCILEKGLLIVRARYTLLLLVYYTGPYSDVPTLAKCYDATDITYMI